MLSAESVCQSYSVDCIRRLRRLCAVIGGSTVAAVVVIGLLGADAEAASSDRPELFGTREVQNKNLKPFPKWTGVLSRHEGDSFYAQEPCDGAAFEACAIQDWKAFLKTIEGMDITAQLDAINRQMNEANYINDLANWGIKDYWETPLQFFMRDGDCEDFAIAKYMSLRALGRPVDDMRVVVLQDQNLDVAHAVLVYYLDGVGYVLDNQIKQVIPQEKVHHYKPFYSVNETAWWLHRG